MDFEDLISNIGAAILLTMAGSMVLAIILVIAALVFVICPPLLLIPLIGISAGIICTKLNIDLTDFL